VACAGVNLAAVQLNGTPVSGMQSRTKQIRIYASPSADGELRMCTMYFGHKPTEASEMSSHTKSESAKSMHDTGSIVKEEEGAARSFHCYHTREFVVTTQGIKISGEVFNSPQDAMAIFEEYYQRADDADRSLIASLLLDTELGDSTEAPTGTSSSGNDVNSPPSFEESVAKYEPGESSGGTSFFSPFGRRSGGSSYR